MIHIDKIEQPEILREKSADWTAEYIQYRSDPDSVPNAAATRYGHEDIKTALCSEAHNKCAYCESKIRHIQPGHIDHIRPKSKRPDLVVDWRNLTLACDVCNRLKGDYYHEAEPLINPFDDDPADHIFFAGPIPLHKDPKGFRTLEMLELSTRIELVDRRIQRLREVNDILNRWQDQEEGPTREILERVLMKETEPNKEYSAAVYVFVVSRMNVSSQHEE